MKTYPKSHSLKVVFGKKLQKQLSQLTLNGWNTKKELAGLLLGRQQNNQIKIKEFVQAPPLLCDSNSFKIPLPFFHIVKQMGKVKNLDLVAIFHTHTIPSTVQSETDRFLPRSTGLLSIVGALVSKSVEYSCIGLKGKKIVNFPI